jgi:hypothetical protein
MKAILRGSEDNAIATFNASHRSIKDAIKRAVELEQASPSRASTTSSARERRWRALELPEPGVGRHRRPAHEGAASLEDLLARETSSRSCRHRAAHQGHRDRVRQTLRRGARRPRRRVHQGVRQAGEDAGLVEIDEDQQRRLAEPFERGRSARRNRVPIPQLRADRDACEGRLRAAVAELRRIIDGERVVTVSVGSYFAAASRPKSSSTRRSTASARSARASSAPARRSSFSKGSPRWTRTHATPSNAPPSGRGSSSRRTSPRSSRATSTCCATARWRRRPEATSPRQVFQRERSSPRSSTSGRPG